MGLVKMYAFAAGVRFGRLVVLGLEPGQKRRSWRCKCDCGNECVVQTGHLNNGSCRSCGCLQQEFRHRPNRRTHGESSYGTDTKEYAAWASMKHRCLCPTARAYKYYGGRGITICKQWLKYERFLKDMGRAPTPAHTLERRDNNKGYFPTNCYWATPKEQVRNRRTTRWIGGRSLIERCEEAKLPYKLVWERLRRGNPITVIFSPLKGREYQYLLNMEKRHGESSRKAV